MLQVQASAPIESLWVQDAQGREVLRPLAANADFNKASPSLYNGNIRHAVYTIARLNELSYARPEGFNYKYDQLNRLIGQRARINYDLSTYLWDPTAAELARFREDIAYDPNGNILRYLRNGHRSSQYLMDSLSYHYEVNTNKLNYIDDKQTGALNVYKGDLKDQSPNNYDYDDIGNLIKDTRDSITRITWTNAQKIDSVIKTDRSIWFKYDAMQNRVVKHSKANSGELEKRTYYIRDAQGNVMATYAGYLTNDGDPTWDSLRLTEQHIYGSARVGTALTNVKLYPEIPVNPHLPDSSRYPIFEGWKHYEISNHLGNVLAVITDRKRAGNTSGSGIDWFDADVVSAQQYYPFGMLMPDTTSTNLRRQYSNPNCFDKDYRYGFNGKEGDDEVKGDDNQQDYGMRIYDPRVGRFLSVDPLFRQFPWNTPYSFAENDVISSIDLDGLEKFKVVLRQTSEGWNAEISISDYRQVEDSPTKMQVNYYIQPLGAQSPKKLVTKTSFDTQDELNAAQEHEIIAKSNSNEGRWNNTSYTPPEKTSSKTLIGYRGTRTQVDIISNDVGEIYSVVPPGLHFSGVAVESDGSISLTSESARTSFRDGIDYLKNKWIPVMLKPREGEKVTKGFMIKSVQSDLSARLREVGIIRKRLVDEGVPESLILTSDIQARSESGFTLERIIEKKE